jgi:hypothetical protein
VGDAEKRRAHAGHLRHISRTLATNRSFDALAVFKPWQPAATATSQADRPERFTGQRVSADYFRTLGIAPLLGRDFQASDDRFAAPTWPFSAIDCGVAAMPGTEPSSASRFASTTRSTPSSASCPSSFENVVNPSAESGLRCNTIQLCPSDGREWGHHLHLIGRLKAGVDTQQAATS